MLTETQLTMCMWQRDWGTERATGPMEPPAARPLGPSHARVGPSQPVRTRVAAPCRNLNQQLAITQPPSQITELDRK